MSGETDPPVDIVISVDEQDAAWLGGLMSLIDSLVLCWRQADPLAVSVVHRGALPASVRRLFEGTTRLTCRFVSLEDDLGIVASDDAAAPVWRRLLGLGYARHTAAPYYLLVDGHAFCIRRFDYQTLLPGGLARSQWEDLQKHPAPSQVARSLLGNGPLLTTGLSVHPVIYATELAVAAMELLERRHGLPAIELLISLCEQRIEWTDNMIYSLANWPRLREFHVPPGDEQSDPAARGLHTDIDLWSDTPDPAWSPKRWAALAQHGLFLSTHASVAVRSVVLDPAYAVLARIA